MSLKSNRENKKVLQPQHSESSGVYSGLNAIFCYSYTDGVVNATSVLPAKNKQEASWKIQHYNVEAPFEITAINEVGPFHKRQLS